MQARFIRMGDIVLTEAGTHEVVRQVQIILSLSNGNNDVHEPADNITVLEVEEVPGRVPDPVSPVSLVDVAGTT